MTSFPRVAVFCGSRNGHDPAYAEAARQTGAHLARHGMELVYGGGNIGLMGLVADAALAHGGRVTGVMPDFLLAKEIGHPRLTELIVTTSMHERKMKMAERADAFVALPGGYGTFDELIEILTWAHLGLHRKPVGVLNVQGFYDPLLALVEHGHQHGFIRRKRRARLHTAPTVEELLAAMAAAQKEEAQPSGRAPSLAAD